MLLPRFTPLPLDRTPIGPHGGRGPGSGTAGEVLLREIRSPIESVTPPSRTMERSDLKTKESPKGEETTEPRPAPSGPRQPGLSGEEGGAGWF